MRETFQDPRDFERVESMSIDGQGLSITVGFRKGRAELVSAEGPEARLGQALELFEEWSDFPAESVDVVEVPDGTPPVLVRLGDLLAISYRSDKFTGREADYIHETKRPRPELFTSPDGSRFFLLGGEMSAEARGLVG